MSAVSAKGALWFTVFLGRFTAPVFTAFLDQLARQAGQKVHVIVDRHPVHRSKAVRKWLATNAERVELHLLPGYSPKLNPDELLNADLKRNVHASRAHTTDQLAHDTRRFLRRRQHQPHLVRGYFRAPTPLTQSCRQPNSFTSIIAESDAARASPVAQLARWGYECIPYDAWCRRTPGGLSGSIG